MVKYGDKAGNYTSLLVGEAGWRAFTWSFQLSSMFLFLTTCQSLPVFHSFVSLSQCFFMFHLSPFVPIPDFPSAFLQPPGILPFGLTSLLCPSQVNKAFLEPFTSLKLYFPTFCSEFFAVLHCPPSNGSLGFQIADQVHFWTRPVNCLSMENIKNYDWF